MQSQGIGKILLNYAKDKRNKLYLNIYQKNARAISFYKREGFEIQHSGLDEATGEAPANAVRCDDGWKAFRIQGILDFSLVGILSKIAVILANHEISIFAVSTYNTDYVLIKSENYQRGLEILEAAGYKIVD